MNFRVLKHFILQRPWSWDGLPQHRNFISLCKSYINENTVDLTDREQFISLNKTVRNKGTCIIKTHIKEVKIPPLSIYLFHDIYILKKEKAGEFYEYENKSLFAFVLLSQMS